MEIKAPDKVPLLGMKVFLAGSIEMGSAEPWQEVAAGQLSRRGFVVLNPRRDDWDSSWEQSVNNPQFQDQVMWEIKAQELADIILMYFDPNTKAPITLLELGLFADSGKLMVVCPDGYWRKGNVDVVCRYYDIPQHRSLHGAIDTLLLA